MNKYVVGFPFNIDGTKTVLIKKNRPQWQVGYFNGIGGHIENNELPSEAMAREFFEEAGVVSNPDDWTLYQVLCNDGWEVNYFYATLNVNLCRQETDEEIAFFDPMRLPKNCISNLIWLIPMALYHRRFPNEFSRTVNQCASGTP